MALAVAYKRRPRTDSRLRTSDTRAPLLLVHDLDPVGPDETLARVLTLSESFVSNLHGDEAEALADAGASWPFLETLDAYATEAEQQGESRRSDPSSVDVDPGEVFLEAAVEVEELESPPTDRDPATVGDRGDSGTDLPIARFEESDDAIAPEDLGMEWLDRPPSSEFPK